VDPLVLIMLIVVGGLFAWVIFLGVYHPRSGADVLDWRPTRSPELEAQNEVDDLDQMLEATNERRRRRGEDELTEQALEARVLEDRRERLARREAYLADAVGETDAEVQADMAQMLARVNEGRRRRGERELTLEEYRAAIESGDWPGS
jgi:predicted S18 family serine protease